MTKEELEKEAEEIANKRCHEIMCYGHCSFSSSKHHRCGEWHREYNCAKEGIVFGYNKANEWHNIKEIEPSKEQIGKQLLIKIESVTSDTDYAYLVYKYNGESMSDVIGVIAWKEIVLPELPKENE